MFGHVLAHRLLAHIQGALEPLCSNASSLRCMLAALAQAAVLSVNDTLVLLLCESRGSRELKNALFQSSALVLKRSDLQSHRPRPLVGTGSSRQAASSGHGNGGGYAAHLSRARVRSVDLLECLLEAIVSGLLSAHQRFSDSLFSRLCFLLLFLFFSSFFLFLCFSSVFFSQPLRHPPRSFFAKYLLPLFKPILPPPQLLEKENSSRPFLSMLLAS